MPEAIQDRPQVSDFHKAINVALEDNHIRELQEYRRCHHQMRYISRGCSVTLAVLYGAQPVECLARDEHIQNKKLEKIDKYQSLKIELEQLWKVKIMVIPVVVGALGAESRV